MALNSEDSFDVGPCILDETPVFIEFVDVYLYIVEDLDLLLERGPVGFSL